MLQAVNCKHNEDIFQKTEDRILLCGTIQQFWADTDRSTFWRKSSEREKKMTWYTS